MMLRRLIALVVLVFLSGCAPAAPAPTATGTAGSPGASSPGLAVPAGPILELVVAADIDDEGNPVDPSFTVPSDQKQITVIARIGEVGSQLELTWHRLPDAWGTDDDAEEELFRHQVEVTSGDVAWSVGTNPGTLASGSYLVRANLGMQTREVVFEVASALSATASSPPGQPTGQPASASAPVSGESGTVEAVSEEGGGSCEEGVNAFGRSIAGPFSDPTADRIDVSAFASGSWGLLPGTLSGACVNLSIDSTALQGRGSVSGEEPNPCALPDGSDLPGTTVVSMWRAYGDVAAELPMTVILGDDTLAPRARVRSEPGPGKQVDEGDQIRVTALAQERRSGGPWQMGVERIQLLSLRPAQELVDSVEFTDRRGKACDEKQWEGTLEATYTVPPDPPPVVELCIVAEDWAGNGAERGSWKCAEFPTGEVWTGTIVEEFAPGGGQVVAEGKNVKLMVGTDGAVNGTWALTFTRCTVPNCNLVGHTDSLTVSGKRDGSGFHLTLTGPGGSVQLDVPVAGKTAKGTLQQQGGGSITVDLKCTSCE
jgi:hypothetical protein